MTLPFLTILALSIPIYNPPFSPCQYFHLPSKESSLSHHRCSFYPKPKPPILSLFLLFVHSGTTLPYLNIAGCPIPGHNSSFSHPLFLYLSQTTTHPSLPTVALPIPSNDPFSWPCHYSFHPRHDLNFSFLRHFSYLKTLTYKPLPWVIICQSHRDSGFPTSLSLLFLLKSSYCSLNNALNFTTLARKNSVRIIIIACKQFKLYDSDSLIFTQILAQSSVFSFSPIYRYKWV